MSKPVLGSLRQYARYLWLFKTTVQGKCLVGAILFAIMVGSASLSIPVYQLVCALAGLAVVAYVAGFLLRPVVSVAGAFPEKATANQPVTGHYTLTDLSRGEAHDLSIGFFGLPIELTPVEADLNIPSLPPGESVTVPVTLHPLRRGLYPLPKLRAYTTFPFHVCRTNTRTRPEMTAALQPGSLLVLPDFHSLAAVDVPVSRRYQPGGIALTSNVGDSTEYIGNRAYRPGDPMRHIDFRSWARLAKPVVREFNEEYYCRVALILDTFIPGRRKPGPRGFPNLEAAISLSAAVADALSRGEYIIDIFAAGPELYVFRAGRHTAHFENILEMLACVEACRTNPFNLVAPAVAQELANISSVICVFLDWDASREGLVRAAVEAGCQPKVAIVRDGDTTLPFAHVADEYAITRHTLRSVHEGGIETL